MKKKKLFLGFAIAAAAVLGLASCGEDATTTTTGTPAPTVQPTVQPTVKPTGSSTKPTESSKDDDTLTTVVVFHKNATGTEIATKTTAKVDVSKKPNIDDLKTTVAGYEAKSITYLDGSAASAYDPEPSGEYKDQYVMVVVYKGLAPEFAKYSGEGNIFTETFPAGTTLKAFGGNLGVTAGFYQAHDSIVIEGGAAKNPGAGKMYVDFGPAKTEGNVKGYFEVTPTAIANAWNLFAFADASKGNAAAMRKLATGWEYTIDGADKTVAEGVDLVAGKTYGIEFDYNIGASSISFDFIKEDGTHVNVCKNVAVTKTICGIEFAGGTGKAQTVDNIAVAYFAPSLDDTKAASKTKIDNALATYTESEYTAEDWATMTGIVTTAKAAIDAATTSADIKAAEEKAISDLSAVNVTKYTITVIGIKGAATVGSKDVEVTKSHKIADSIDYFNTIEGYHLVNKTLYTEEAMTTLAGAVATANATVYVEVSDEEINEFTFAAADVNATADKEVLVDGMGIGSYEAFKIVSPTKGQVVARVNGDGVCTSIEVGKGNTSFIAVNLAKAATLTVDFSSTGGTNTTAGCGIFTKDADGKYATAAGTTLTDCEGTGATTKTYELAAGTYYIGCTETSRAARVLKITATYK